MRRSSAELPKNTAERRAWRPRAHRWSDRVLGVFAPSRRRGIEYLDEPGVDERLVRRSLFDVTLANRLFGGTHAVLAELDELYDEDEREGPDAAPLVLLDVG